MATPLVSVIIPVGPRHAAHCRTAAASALGQSIGRAAVEVIVIGDGAAEIAPMDGVTLLPSTGTVRGPAHTRNRGIEAARGRFITFLDADDYLLPRGLEHLLRAYSSGRHGYTYGNAYTLEPWHLADQLRGKPNTTIDDRAQRIYTMRAAPDYAQRDMAHYNLHVITTLIPARHVRAVGGFDERIDAWEDWAFHLRLAMAGVCGYRTDLPVFVYQVYEGDRMTQFYHNKVTMEPVWQLYRNEQGVIPMSGCCGGDSNLAHVADQAVAGLPPGEPVAIGENKVRVRYVGDEKGSIPFDFGGGVLIRLGANGSHRYADVTPAQAAWLKERIPIEVVPKIDPPVAPPAPLPTVLKADAPAKALRLKGREVQA